ncbi:GSCFA domain-containing protein [Parasphingopyxis sp.]|uniref:GSCFA domain-containing protein n=1 Tax=Parasphingopyxis sp. TaxID=1920299 RepID=UPI002631275C|nr:GSCFA domain-containing protein [Parasphingopyxis sp.]
MAIVEIPGKQALRYLKQNKAASWGNRSIANRVEPIAAPAFEVPFQLEPGEKIYTIGSCFARNVETALIRKGYELPVRRLFSTPAFEGLEPAIVNNFGTPSIYHEIAWAFGEERFDEDKAFLQLGRNKYIDLHMVSSLRPAPLETLRARREGLFTATRALADCRVIIMTLGLVEIWWDEETQLYLNTQPPRAVQRKSPDRFSLHVLDVAQCMDYLERALDTIFRNGRADSRVILTVSPVPMTATHRPVDVMTANAYSKSVLRVVSEYIVQKYERVSYFPSYETVTISDRQLAWMDDLVHVRDEMVAFNVDRMVEAFSGTGKRAEIALPLPARETAPDVKASFLAEEARHARLRGDNAFFEEHRDAVDSSAAFAIEYARLLKKSQAYDEAVAVLAPHDSVEAQLLRARCFIDAGDYQAATEAAERVCDAGHKGVPQWRVLLEAITKRGAALDELEAIEEKWRAAAIGIPHVVQLHCGVAMRDSGFLDAALDRLERAADSPLAKIMAFIELAQCQLAAGNPEAAIDTLRECAPETDPQKRAIRSIRAEAEEMLSERSK